MLRLHWRNRMALDFYYRMTSVPGVRSRLLACPVTQKNMHIIRTTIESARVEAQNLAVERARSERDDEE
jgi:hypothetical protein